MTTANLNTLAVNSTLDIGASTVSMKGFENLTLTAAGGASDALNFASTASIARQLALGTVDAAIVGGVDSLCLTTLYGFASLQLTSAEACRPYDAGRNGISIGEGAAFGLLERVDRATAGDILLLHDGHARRTADGTPVLLQVLPAPTSVPSRLWPMSTTKSALSSLRTTLG